jgi:hypothetical protein
MKSKNNSQISPLRFDKLSDVKYKSTSKTIEKPPLPQTSSHQTSFHKTSLHQTSQPSSTDLQDSRPHFLFTLGPRPFWELWPLKRCKKKHLTSIEFRACLLDRWAKTRNGNHLQQQRNSQLFQSNINKNGVFQTNTKNGVFQTNTKNGLFHQTTNNNNSFSSSGFLQQRNHRRVRSTR